MPDGCFGFFRCFRCFRCFGCFRCSRCARTNAPRGVGETPSTPRSFRYRRCAARSRAVLMPGLRRTGGRATARAGRRAQRRWRPSRRGAHARRRPAPMMVTALTSTSKPESLPDTSLATMTSMPLRSRLARARSTTSWVSAAKPTSSGAVRPSRPRQAATSARISGVGDSVRLSVPSSCAIFCAATLVRGVVGNGGRHHQRIGLRHGRPARRDASARPIGRESPRRRPEGRWPSAR